MTTPRAPLHRTVEAVWRIESGRVIDALRRRQLLDRKVAEFGHELGDEQFTPDFDVASGECKFQPRE